MKTGIKYLWYLFLMTMLAAVGLSLIFEPKNPARFGENLARFTFTFFGIPAFFLGVYMQRRKKRNESKKVLDQSK